jgi:hypothetical protein
VGGRVIAGMSVISSRQQINQRSKTAKKSVHVVTSQKEFEIKRAKS